MNQTLISEVPAFGLEAFPSSAWSVKHPLLDIMKDGVGGSVGGCRIPLVNQASSQSRSVHRFVRCTMTWFVRHASGLSSNHPGAAWSGLRRIGQIV